MHGGAAGSGAPAGNKNALNHVRCTRELIEFRRSVRRAATRGGECTVLLKGRAGELTATVGLSDHPRCRESNRARSMVARSLGHGARSLSCRASRRCRMRPG